MDKRYQVFVSSTYADLKEERRTVIQALMEMDCIPAGMELFPAADEEQFQFIKRIIDDCDYYILIIGGRYGSTTPEGLSYTEKEYDYAREKGMRVLAFIHEKPDEISLKNSEIDPVLRTRLASFREKARTDTLVKMWANANELPGLVALSLLKTIKSHPAIGWLRADQLANSEALKDLNDLRKRTNELERQNKRLVVQLQEKTPAVTNLAALSDLHELGGRHWRHSCGTTDWQMSLTWGELFAAIGPHILAEPNDAAMEVYFGIVISEIYKKTIYSAASYSDFEIFPSEYQTLKIQLSALNLVDLEMKTTISGGVALFWSLTNHGKSMLVDLRTEKKTK